MSCEARSCFFHSFVPFAFGLAESFLPWRMEIGPDNCQTLSQSILKAKSTKRRIWFHALRVKNRFSTP